MAKKRSPPANAATKTPAAKKAAVAARSISPIPGSLSK